MKGKKGFMAIKIDLEKAYDRLKWSFIVACLRALSFPENIINIIEICISSLVMQILWNGNKSESFQPSRGIRQGDPLSPYLFVICMEKLAHLIQEHLINEKWKPIRLSKNGPPISHLFFADDLVIFAEAKMDQVNVIKHYLEVFCNSSGQRVNSAKTRVFFSRNVNHNIRSQLSERLGFSMAADLGKYLGVPLHHKRVTKSTYQFIVDKVRKRLSNWKCHSLSLAGRSTLIKSVAAAIPNHVMQTSLLPIECCEEMDKSSRSFLWGSTEAKRKAHLLAWDKVCKSKPHGGLGMRHTRWQNCAFMMKVGWGLISNREALWSKVVRCKYKCGNELLPKIDMKRAGSRVWSGIKSTWEYVRNGVEIVNHQGSARVRWKHDRSGQFSVKSAYNLVTRAQDRGSTYWSKIWQLQVPHKCRTQMWLMLHDRLLTNESLMKKGLHPDGLCETCGVHMESSLHVLRDCKEAKLFWLHFGISPTDNIFWGSALTDWLVRNLQTSKATVYGRWNDLFNVTCWLLWRRRNERVHNNIQTNIHDGLAEIRGIVKCVTQAKVYYQHGNIPIAAANKDQSGGSNRVNDWSKVYVDGAFSHEFLVAGCGGILKRADGSIMESFMCRMEGNDCVTAELWGCIWGLRRAWDAGLRKVKLHCDSHEVVALVSGGNFELHEDRQLILEVKHLLSRDWESRILIVDRRDNEAADTLAKSALSMGFGLQILSELSTDQFLREKGVT